MKKTILVSDLSGEEIPDGTGATVTVRHTDARRGVKELHVTDKESDELGAKGRSVARRGRKPATATSSNRRTQSAPA